MKKYKQCVYYGVVMNSKRHGFGKSNPSLVIHALNGTPLSCEGIMVYQNGRVFEGCWENDLKHGRGYEHFQNGSHYEGTYVRTFVHRILSLSPPPPP